MELILHSKWHGITSDDMTRWAARKENHCLQDTVGALRRDLMTERGRTRPVTALEEWMKEMFKIFGILPGSVKAYTTQWVGGGD
jgi:hypothetical protein